MRNSVDSLIAALGGTTAVADAIGAGRTNVANWRAFGTIPSMWYMTFRALCFDRHIALDERLFSWRDAG